MTKSPRSTLVIYPFLFGIYPVLALIAHNIGEMSLTAGLRALSLSILFTLLLYLAIYFLIGNSSKAALLVSLVVLFIFSYGHLLYLLRETPVLNFSWGRHRTLVPLYTGLFIIIAAIIQKTKRDLSTLTKFLNTFAIIILIFPIYQIISYQVQVVIADIDQRRAIAATSVVSLPQDQPAPDVYYILTDGYPRSDFITEYLGYDNTKFLDKLTSKGFYVAQCSQSNYTDTRFAMASTFNMIYLDNGTGLSEVVSTGTSLESMIRSGTVQQNFSDLGYTLITLESGYKWLRWADTDFHFDPAIERARRQFLKIEINDFEKLLLDTTVAKLIIDIPFVLNPEEAKRLEEIINSPRASHRDRVFYSLKKIPEIAETISGPKFVYAHIIFPHPPFIVNAEANSLQNSPSNELTAYADQIAYLNSRLIEIVDTLIEESDPDPVIIIQGDHGATVEYEALGIDKSNRLGILNAYYLPPTSIGTKSPGINFSGAGSTDNGQNTNLYSTITPVNTFRLIFDKYFNGNYGLLEDKSIIGRQSPFTTLECPFTELN
jgi:hypothetical protein